MTSHTVNHQQIRSAAATSFVNKALTMLEMWGHRTKTRKQLAEMPAHLLHDIGLSESDRYQEVCKPFWKN